MIEDKGMPLSKLIMLNISLLSSHVENLSGRWQWYKFVLFRI